LGRYAGPWELMMTNTMLVDRLDHIVLMVNDIEQTMLFYEQTLGMERESFVGSEGQLRHALRFGNQKINGSSEKFMGKEYRDSRLVV
jgi:catechol 2,3-dioxygenase-like lactoylglutathione lyase family enzyme